jgi:hypothetical protein
MSMSFYGGSNVGGAKERIWFSYFKSFNMNSGGSMKYYPGCSTQGCVDGAGLCRGMVTHVSVATPPVKLAQVNADWKFTTGNQLPPEAWEMLRCIAEPNQEGFKLAVATVLIEVANEHTWF